jgi:1-deoxy-D-xylulose-5-phosphate reductoisomerase
MKPLDFSSGLTLGFEGPDHHRFPSINMAKEVFKKGGTAPAVFNAANEIAVAAFLKNKLPFVGIWQLIQDTVDKHTYTKKADLATIIAADTEARLIALDLIESLK